MYYSNEDFENFYVRYKAEGLPRNICLKEFCMRNNVPWNLFDKWHRDTHHRIVPVQVTGRPETEVAADRTTERTDENPKPGSVAWEDSQMEKPEGKREVRIMVDIRMTNGMQVRQKNLNYGQLVGLVEKLEALC